MARRIDDTVIPVAAVEEETIIDSSTGLSKLDPQLQDILEDRG